MPSQRWIKWIALIGVVWNVIGIASYFAHVGIGGPGLAGDPMPAAVTAAYAIGVFAGAAGALGLALLRPWAPALLWLSLVAAMVNWSWVFLHSGDAEIPLGVTVLVVAVVLAALAEFARRHGWLQGSAPR